MSKLRLFSRLFWLRFSILNAVGATLTAVLIFLLTGSRWGIVPLVVGVHGLWVWSALYHGRFDLRRYECYSCPSFICYANALTYHLIKPLAERARRQQKHGD